MATVSTTITGAKVDSVCTNLQRYRTFNAGNNEGVFALSWSKNPTATETASFDGAGDFLEICTFGANTYLLAATVTVPDMDAHATPTITLDLQADSVVLVNDNTAGQAGGDIEFQGKGFVDVSSKTLKLKVETGPATAQTDYGAFSAKLLVYQGAPAGLN